MRLEELSVMGDLGKLKKSTPQKCCLIPKIKKKMQFYEIRWTTLKGWFTKKEVALSLKQKQNIIFYEKQYKKMVKFQTLGIKMF